MENNKNIEFTSRFLENLALLFIALKLCGVIHVSWIWVLCPLWIGGALVLIGFVLTALIGVGLKAKIALRRKTNHKI